MRVPIFLVLLALTACSDKDRHGDPPPATRSEVPLTEGEERAVIAGKGEAGALLRSGPRVPAQLPSGFSLYPGTNIVSSTVVERSGQTRSLVVMETAEPIEAIMAFYRAQARAAGLDVQVDLGGDERASLGGHLKGGGDMAISARRAGGITRIELAGTQGR